MSSPTQDMCRVGVPCGLNGTHHENGPRHGVDGRDYCELCSAPSPRPDREYVWSCFYQYERPACTPENPDDECRWVLR